jgi:hypothetical protein
LIGRRAALGLPFEQLIDEMNGALRRLHRRQSRTPGAGEPAARTTSHTDE